MLSVDHAMTVAGAGLAMGVAAFAVFAVEKNDGVPRVSGQEHLALFSKPARPHDDRAIATSPARIDYAPTATIKAPPTRPQRVTRAVRDRVLIEDSTESRELRPGDTAPGFGRLEDIRIVDGRWTAIFGETAKQSQSSR